MIQTPFARAGLPGSTPGLGFILTRVLTPFAIGYFLSYLYRSVNAVIAPDLTRSLGLDASALGLLTSAYFVTFAAMQLPIGILLDRFGPRRVEATLLLFAAAGAATFAVAGSATELFLGRALIGMGVSACLMASFKANVLWFPRPRLPLVNGIILASGGLGALTATAPVEAALALTDWRGVFFGLAALTAAVAAGIFLVVPERRGEPPAEPLAVQIREVGLVFGSWTFWRLAPLPMISQGAFMALQGLWAGPWLRDVAGLERGVVATHLMAVAAAMVVGFVTVGAVAERLARRGVPVVTIAIGGMAAFTINQATIAAGWTGAPLLTWMLFGLLGTTGSVSYAVMSQAFPTRLAGRVITGLNLLVFIAAFSLQWGVGAVIDLWPRGPSGGYPATAYQVAFGAVVVLQMLAFAWYFAAGRAVSARTAAKE